MEKQDLITKLKDAQGDLEFIEGNIDALTKAFDHIQEAIDLIEKYAIE